MLAFCADAAKLKRVVFQLCVIFEKLHGTIPWLEN